MSSTDHSPNVARPVTAYDSTYARTYGDRWWQQELWRADGAWYEALIRERLGPNVRWLDVGCGTGHFLSCFPNVTRAGLDLSADMIEVAAEANPGVTFRRGDATEPFPEWHGQWDLVTCTGEPWSYLSTLADFERWVANMAAWTSPDGVCLNQTPDVTELASATVDYRFTDDEPTAGTVTVLGVMWDMAEHDMTHGQMIWPSIDVWARWYGRHFRRVEILHPAPGSGVIFGRTIVASEKRAPGDDRPTTYVLQPWSATEPNTLHQEADQPPDPQIEALRAELADVRRQMAHLTDLVARPDGSEATDAERYDIIGVIHDQVGGIRRELAELSQRLGSGSPAPSPIRRALGRATRRLRS